MRTSFRTFSHRVITYPFLVPAIVAYSLVKPTFYKRIVLDAFYLIRGLPHGYTRRGLRIASFGNMKITFPLNEDPAFDDVWLRDVYFLYRPKIDHIVIDVGAHMGFFTLRIARNVEKVVAIEPDPTNFIFLTLNVRQNELQQKVTLCNLALSQNDGLAFLDRNGYGYGRSKITTERTKYLTKTRRLDSLAAEIALTSVDLIKIDTEGSELDVLKGAEEILCKYKPDLLIAAYHFPNEHLMIAGYLRKHGYSVFCYSIPLALSFNKETYLYATDNVRTSKASGLVDLSATGAGRASQQ